MAALRRGDDVFISQSLPLESVNSTSHSAACIAPLAWAEAYPKAATPLQPPLKNNAGAPPCISASSAHPRLNAWVPQDSAFGNPKARAATFKVASAVP